MRHYDLVIIGTGSGNTIPDERFADLRVAIVEEGTFGGTCLNVGCIPTKMFVHAADLAASPAHAAALGVDLTVERVRWRDIRDRVFGRIDPLAAGGERYRRTGSPNITVHSGHGRFTGHKRLEVTGPDGVEEITGDRFVIAAGGRARVPEIPGLRESGFHTNDDIMRIDELPRRLVIVGGGFIACEFAHVFSAFGVEITMIARSDLLLRDQDEEVSRRFSDLAAKRWDVRPGRRITSVERGDGGVTAHTEGPHGTETISGDALLLAVGRVPNADLLNVAATGVTCHPDGRVAVDARQRTVVDGIYALGDISSRYQLKHVANHEARVVAHNLLHPDDPITADHRFVPHAVFSSPQIAAVGITEQEARARGIAYITSTQDYGDTAYGWALEDTTSFCKLIANPGSGRLIGAHLIGPQASTLIQPLIQAMHLRQDVRSLARDQYWIHPSLPEVVENALLKLPF